MSRDPWTKGLHLGVGCRHITFPRPIDTVAGEEEHEEIHQDYQNGWAQWRTIQTATTRR